jgi:hypothetical protein
LLYVFRGIAPEFRDDVMRARITYSGNLHFESLDDSGHLNRKEKQTMIGREWEYRSYIAGGGAEEGVWEFNNLPASMQEMERVPVEFNLDIFRTTKGGEDYKEGVSCQFTFVNPDRWDYAPESYTAYRQAVEADPSVRLGERERAEKYGYYELPSPITIVDYKTFKVDFPGALLKGGNRLVIRVACRTPSQYLGMAKHDLYLVTGDGNFYFNFLKSTSGIWFAMVIMVTLGVVFSTYLNALIALLLTWLFMLGGLSPIRNFVQVLSSANWETNPGGGPGESLLRLAKRENLTTPLEENLLTRIFTGGNKADWFSIDGFFRGFFRFFHDILPNLGQFDREMFIAEGFNTPGADLAMNVLILAAYLLPFLVLGYYLLNSREVAG